MHRFALALLAIPLTTSAAQIELTRTQLCRHAERIIVGEVTDIETRFTDTDRIERVVHLAVNQTLKGSGPTDITLTAAGGTIGDLTLWVEHSPIFLEDATYLLFLGSNDTVIAGEQGVVRVTKAAAKIGETLDEAVASIEVCRAN